MPMDDHQILARWRAQLRDVECSPLNFLDLVGTAVEETLFPDIHLSNVLRREGAFFSADRVYLRIRHQRLYFDVSAFVAGRVLSVAYWLHEDPPGLRELFSEIPAMRAVLSHLLERPTYYRVDAIETFQHVIHDAILSVCDQLADERRNPLLPNEERQPVWEEIW